MELQDLSAETSPRPRIGRLPKRSPPPPSHHPCLSVQTVWVCCSPSIVGKIPTKYLIMWYKVYVIYGVALLRGIVIPKGFPTIFRQWQRTIFTLPNSDVYDSPGSVMVAFDQAVVPGMDSRTVELIKWLGMQPWWCHGSSVKYAQLYIIPRCFSIFCLCSFYFFSLFSDRFGENCLPSDDGTYNYTKMASEMKTTSLEGASGMEIAGGSRWWFDGVQMNRRTHKS